MRKILIVSLKYNPGLLKEFKLIGDNLKKYNYDVGYILSIKYKNVISPDENAFFLETDYIVKSYLNFNKQFIHVEHLLRDADDIFIYNAHPANWKLFLKAFKFNEETRRIVMLHEPHVSFKDKFKYGIKGFLKSLFIDYFSYKLLNLSTDICLPSEFSKKLYEKRLIKFKHNKLHEVRLLLPEIDTTNSKNTETIIISFVGTINKARNIELIERLADFCNYAYPNIEFRVLTKNKSLIDETKKIQFLFKDTISDDDINNFILESDLLFLTHSVAAQSGNIPVAYRLATPVICFDTPGITQHVEHNETGYILNKKNIQNDFIEIISHYKINKTRMRILCTKYFINSFSEYKFDEYYDWFLYNFEEEELKK